jgi:hypothetical protein
VGERDLSVVMLFQQLPLMNLSVLTMSFPEVSVIGLRHVSVSLVVALAALLAGKCVRQPGLSECSSTCCLETDTFKLSSRNQTVKKCMLQ